MIYELIIGMSLFFVVIGYVITGDNAEHLLSGYNTLSEIDKHKVDIKKYISFFRKFHIFFGVLFLICGIILTYWINEDAGAFFLMFCPGCCYVYFIGTGSKYSKDQNINIFPFGKIN